MWYGTISYYIVASKTFHVPHAKIPKKNDNTAIRFPSIKLSITYLFRMK